MGRSLVILKKVLSANVCLNKLKEDINLLDINKIQCTTTSCTHR